MRILRHIEEIDKQQWERLLRESSTATWFQTCEAYNFYASVSDIFMPYVVAVEGSREIGGEGQELLRGIIVGYVTKERSAFKQFFTRRAIIMGGPLLAEDIADDELQALLQAMREYLAKKAIYIETRNFNDYSQWKDTFEACGFAYQAHLNVIQDLSFGEEQIYRNLHKDRKRNLRRAEQYNLQFREVAYADDIQKVIRLVQHTYQRVRVPFAYTPLLQQAIHQQDFRFFAVIKDGEIVAGQICVCHKEVLHAWFTGSDERFFRMRINDFLMWKVMLWGKMNGYTCFNFGGAGEPHIPSGTRDFKVHFGGEMVEYGRFLCVQNSWLYKIGSWGVRMMRKFSR